MEYYRLKKKFKRIICGFLSVLMIVSFVPDFRLIVKAEEGATVGGQSNIVNGSFEDPSNYRLADLNEKNINSQKGYKEKTPQSEIPGWNTTSTEGAIEIGWLKSNGTSPHMIPTVVTEITGGIGASDGWQFAETIGNEASTIYQSLILQSGMKYNWTIHHRGRDGVDTLALFIVKEADNVNYVKSTKESSDHFNGIVNWMKNTKGISAPAAGKMERYTIYTTALDNNGAFTESDAGYFSFDYDEEHIVKFEVHLMSTAKTDWGEYTGRYESKISGNVLFALTCFQSASTSQTSGNLVDNLSFSNVYDNKNMLANAGFEDAEVSSASGYQLAKAANASSPTSKIGWSSTASDYVVEIGSLRGGKDAYGLGVTFNTETHNAPSIKDGSQFAELNADQESSLYQIVDTDPGKMYKWSLSHRGRNGIDTMALVIGPAQDYLPKKTSATARDQLMQIVDWLYSQKDVVLDVPDKGCSAEIKLYTPKFNDSGGFVLSENIFSWYADEMHTEEWSVWIISSDNSKWYDYGELESGAAYNYDYIVPQGQNQGSIFGFVSVKASGTTSKSYGNFLDNIAFKEYYYINAKFDGNEDVGFISITPDDSKHFIHTDRNDEGWAIKGSTITVSFQEGGRTFLGAYVNGVYHPADDRSFWTVDQEKKVYSFEQVVDSAVTVKVVYQAKNVIYETQNGTVYQYDPLDSKTGREVPMGIDQEGHLREYISHAPLSDDGWEFLGWRYIEIEGEKHTSHLVDAVHKVQCDYNESTDITTLSIWKGKDENGNFTVEVDKDISIDKGITFFGEWKYRQRVVAQTFDQGNSSYKMSTDGGEVYIKIAFPENENPSTDYKVGEEIVGREIFATADGTYINITAKNKTDYVFNGWYDKSGNLVSRNPSYTYKVVDGGVFTYYAHFEPYGHNLTINTKVDGEADKYFVIDCVFSGLRKDQLYAISGLITDPITVNGKLVNNPAILRANDNGEAQITIYVKHNDSAVFEYLPENCFYSVTVNETSKVGYSVLGEVSKQKLETNDATVNLVLKNSKQYSWIEPGKHYQDISNHDNSSGITLTPESSYTLYVETTYAPSFYNNLSASLCFFNAEGEAQDFAVGTRILMVDMSIADKPSFYYFSIVNESINKIALTDFTELGSNTEKFKLPSSTQHITERLLFVVDYIGVEGTVPSGKIALVYRNDSVVTISPEYKTVAIDDDSTFFFVTGKNGNTASVGPFEMQLTVSASSPAVNTTYVRYDDGNYSVKLSLNDGTLPEGSYAEVNGKIYHSNNGYIIVSPLDPGEITVNLYLSKPPAHLTDNKVNIKAELLSAASISSSIPKGISNTVEFNCIADIPYAMDADIDGKVLKPGSSQVEVNLKYDKIDNIKLTVKKKNDNSEILQDIDVGLPTENNPLTVNLESETGETYVFYFVGYSDGVPVCWDECYAVGGYILVD